MSNKSFLFVNKDLSSASLSNNRTGKDLPYSRINRHVQRLSAKERLKNRSTVANSAKKLVGWSSIYPASGLSLISDSSSDLPKEDGSTTTDTEIKAEDDIADVIPDADEPSSAPLATLNSCSNAVIKLTTSEHKALQYFLRIWMPSNDRIPLRCQIAGFTPIWPHDGEISTEVLRGALQSSDAVSIYALLAASARRMQSLNGQKPERSELPELYSFNAVQALRRRMQVPVATTQRLILDVSYLSLADLYAKDPVRSEIYWKINRDLIIRCGGLHMIDPFIAKAAIAYDYFLALGTLTAPALDPLSDPALLGIDPDLPKAQLKLRIKARLAKLEPRVRVTSQLKRLFTPVLKALKALPQPAIDKVSSLVNHHVPNLYPLISGPFLPSGDNKMRDTNGAWRLRVMAADVLSLQTRTLFYHAWVWFAALRCAERYMGKSNLEAGTPPVFQGPEHVTNIFRAYDPLDRICDLLVDSGWIIMPDLLLWMYAAGFLFASSQCDRKPFRSRLVQHARTMHIPDIDTLRNILSIHLPLEIIEPNWLQLLWHVMQVEAAE